ncbi:hypothetical protein [Vibrio parahaemolyticus]|uniref:hypothetical protein n=1 Tax=Vibrio parahaemolyticus TaxID=670 RepID=UPI000A5ED048|nr:hypothetical protein [Vibrio parahaemolyticus]
MGYNLSLLGSVWGVVSACIIFFFGLLVSYFLSKKLNLSSNYCCFLYLYHTAFCLVYLNIVNNSGGDALTYYLRSSEPLLDFRPGTIAVIYFSSLINIFEVGPLSMSLVFNIFGYLGVLLFYAAVINIVDSWRNVTLIFVKCLFLLPSMHFWTSGIGKDSLFFFSVGLLIYSSLNISKNLFLLVCVISIMMLVRPHMAGVCIIALSLSLIFSRNISLILRVGILIISLGMTSLIIPFGLKYAGVEGGVSGVDAYIETRETKNTSGGSSIDLTSMSMPEKFFSYLFRPLPYEVSGISQFLASVDNLILMAVLFYAVLCKVRYRRYKHSFSLGILFFYALGSLSILSLTSANLGIAVRQKWMFMPILLFISLYFILNYEKKN